MTIIIATDKFKGSLSSLEAGQAVERGIKKKNPLARSLVFPMADGGDGFAAVLKYYLGTTTISCSSLDPLNRSIAATYEWDLSSKTAIIEVAAASGLVLLKEEERNALLSSTEGTGMLILDAIGRGAEKILLGLGGSATNDAGMGILKALGFQLLDRAAEPLAPCGASLSAIREIVLPSTIANVKFSIACDVQNVLFGPQGAAHVYAPQKGADEKSITQLDEGLRNIATIIQKQTGKEIAMIPGAGAAGGIAAGLMGFLPVEMKSGINLIVEASGLKKKIMQADLLITGEGKLDAQSGQGKVVGEIAALAREYGIPCTVVCGKLELEEAAYQKMGIQKVIALDDGMTNLDELMKRAGWYLERNVANMRMW